MLRAGRSLCRPPGLVVLDVMMIGHCARAHALMLEDDGEYHRDISQQQAVLNFHLRYDMLVTGCCFVCTRRVATSLAGHTTPCPQTTAVLLDWEEFNRACVSGG